MGVASDIPQRNSLTANSSGPYGLSNPTSAMIPGPSLWESCGVNWDRTPSLCVLIDRGFL